MKVTISVVLLCLLFVTLPFGSGVLRAGGSKRLNEACRYNTDCLQNMYCSGGLCDCTSNAVVMNEHCYLKINPGQSGCQYHIQCTSVWPGTACSTIGSTIGVCICPTNFSPAKTRDGTVCIQTIGSDGIAIANPAAACPLPELSLTSTNRDNLRSRANNVLMSCNPAAANTGLAIGTDCVVAGQNVGDLYDCIGVMGQPTGSTTGICCPNRASICTQSQMSGGTGPMSKTRFWYNSITGTCQQFTWNGGGTLDLSNTNGNNFGTLEQCQSYCACQRGSPQYSSSIAQQDGMQFDCSTSSSGCTTNHGCLTIGSKQWCCPDISWICSYNGGRAYGGITQTIPDFGFEPISSTTGTLRYYYSSSSGTCQQFTYKGVGGNFNNFFSESDCINYCSSELCTHGDPLKLTNGKNQHCNGDSDCPDDFQCSRNNQGGLAVCCPRAQAACNEKSQPGLCNQWTTRFYYDPYARECRPFDYSGCKGNDNNFKTNLKCQTFCSGISPEPQCIQGRAYKDYGGNFYKCSGSSYTAQCSANYECYFDGFVWSCCPQKAYSCSISNDAGKQCGPVVTRWYFDSANQRCESFQYKGCDGNPNNFISRQMCENYCGVGGCPNGGNPFKDPSTGASAVCSMASPCPPGYECDTVNTGGSSINYCCPTKAQICSEAPAQSTFCGSSSVQRFYFSPTSKTCITFTYQGCETNGNNFGTLSQCQNFCSSSACKAGEIALINGRTQTPVTCNRQVKNSCGLPGYTCRYDTLTAKDICCGSTDEGVCPSGEKAYMDALTLEIRTCLPDKQGTCSGDFQCRFSFTKQKYFCCAPISGKKCPQGEAIWKNRATGQVQQCQLNVIYNQCETGYSCQTTGTGPYQVYGYCCSNNPICPSNVEFNVDGVGNPVQCVINSPYNPCQNGFSCQTTQVGATYGYCCKGGSNLENAGCPTGQYVYKLNGQVQYCSPYTHQPCPTNYGYMCLFINPPYNRYQCCGTTPISF